MNSRGLTPIQRSQSEVVDLRNADPIAWLRDKAERRVPIDTRGVLNAEAVLIVCRLAEKARQR